MVDLAFCFHGQQPAPRKEGGGVWDLGWIWNPT
jgi:hypothetical protein